MSNLLRLAFMVAILIVVFLLPALLQPEWACDLGLNQWKETVLANGLFGDPEPCRVPDPQSRALQRRNEKKERIIAELLADRITLFEAAALFRCLNVEDPKLEPFGRFPDSEEERTCRQVIRWAWAALAQHHPEAADAHKGCLEGELRRHKEQYGKVILPDFDQSELKEGESGRMDY